MTYNENWTTTKPRHGELKNMPVPANGIASVKVRAAEDFIYLMLNFITETGSLRGQYLNNGDYVVTSYGTPIAAVVDGKKVLNTTNYSKTTSTHQAIVLDAWVNQDVELAIAEAFPSFV